MEEDSSAEAYQIHVWIRGVSPMIWRRLLVRSDSTIADLHYTLQIAFDWTDLHLHRFHIHGQDYGISRIGGAGFSSDVALYSNRGQNIGRMKRVCYKGHGLPEGDV